MALTVVRGLRARGHEVFVVASGWNDGEFKRRLDDEQIPHLELFFGKISKSLRPQAVAWTLDAIRHLPTARRELRRHLRRFAPDVVIAYNRDWMMLAGSILKRQRTVFHAHELPRISLASRMTYRALGRATRRFVAASQHVAQRLGELGVLPDQTVVIYNGLERADDPIRERPANRDGPPVIGIIGQVAPWKGYDDLVEALAILNTTGLPFRCVAFGEGDEDYERMLRAKADSLGVGNMISWSGYVADSRQAFAEMDICVVPSRVEEAFGLVAVEAGLHRLPVVATRSGALEEVVIDGVTGFVVDPRSPQALARRLAELLASPQLRSTLGASGCENAVRRFRASRMVEHFEALCNALSSA